MKTHTNRFAALTTVAAVRGALIAMVLAACPGTAAAQDPEPQTTPISTVDVGVGPVSQGSYKAGEFNGLAKKGGFLIGNLDLRSHAAFDSPSALRWRIKGTDLGLQTRSLSAQVGVQGRFRVRFGFDELLRNRSDSYQTPYNGAGTNVLTLPGTWLVPTVAGSGGTNPASARGLVTAIGVAPFISTGAADMGALVSPTATQMALVNAAANADVSLFHNVNLHTTRTKYDAGFNYIFDSRWAFDASFRPEHKDGLKPMGTVSRNTGADISTVIPDRIDTETNQISLSQTFKGKKSFAQAGYYGSFFTNNVPSMSWQNWAVPAGSLNANTISSTPSNDFNQFTATGGFNLSATTKLVATGSYARNTQNVAFITDASTPVVPVSSLNGLVVSTAFNTKFTTRPAKKLNLTAAYKYDDRDNRTPVQIYQYADANEPLPTSPNASFPAGPNNPLGAIIAQNANANRPYSKKLNQFDFDADYAVAKRQWIKGSYGFEKVDYACHGSWISCADAPTTNEHTLRAEWRANISEGLTARVSYAYAERRAPSYDENAFLALVPYANVSPAAATGGATALSFMNASGWNGWGPALGFTATTGNMNLFFPSNNALANGMYANNNRISELPGMRRYYVADRNRDKVRTLLNWQATDQLSFQAGVDVNKDAYPNSTYGLQNANSWAWDLDGTYALTDVLSVNVFYTFDNYRSRTAGNTYTANSNVSSIANSQPGVVSLSGNSCDGYTTLQQRNNNNKLDPCLDWSADRLDKANTLGFGLSEKAGKLNLTGNVIATRARWDNNVSGGNWANNLLNGLGAAPTTIAAMFISATPLPATTSDTVELRLNGKYTIGKGQALRMSYAYLHMRSADSMYEGMQFGSLSTQLPTSEQPFKYTVNVFGLSYVLSF
jgi:MtrB/PioB family decaheme-associated outer membrane protein